VKHPVSYVNRPLGEVTTRELLEELRLRGDLAMVAMPTSDRGADGAALSALAGALLKSSCLGTLEAKRGE
jgi:hypothetical protein